MILSIILNGIVVGCIYSLIATGLTLIFGVMKIINMCHGDIVMLGMYASYFLHEKFGISPYLSVFVVAPVFFSFGVFLYKFIELIPLKYREMNSLIVTLGISFVLATSVMLLFSADYRVVNLPYASEVFEFGGIRLGMPYILSSLFALFLVIVLYLILMKTHLGRAIRAASQDPQTAQSLGINEKRISAFTYGIGVTLAGIAGCIISPILYAYPFVGNMFTVKAFTIVVLGGMGSVSGAFLGSLLFGTAEALAGSFLEYSMKDFLSFLIFILFLIFKPTGLFGGKVRV